MKNFHCTFTRTEKVETEIWENITGKLLYDLSLLGKVEDIDGFTLCYYAKRLAQHAEPLERCPGMLFFGYAAPDSMPSDCRVEYFYKPTYAATMFLMKAVLLDSSLLEERICPIGSDDKGDAPVLRDVLRSCMLGCTGRGFMGSGFDDIDGLADAMLLFSGNGTSLFLEKYGDLCPKFTELYYSKIELIRAAVERGGLKGSWGNDHTATARKILENHEKKAA